MNFYHFTSAVHLRGIARYGLTVGDVPTDIRRFLGRVGIWLTTSPAAGGHGLEGSAFSKTEYRLTVEIPEASNNLHRWLEWAKTNVTAETIELLHRAAAKHAGEGPESWYVYFGVLPPDSIICCVRTATGEEIHQWGELSPPALDTKAVPPWRRDAWHRQLLKKIRRVTRTPAD